LRPVAWQKAEDRRLDPTSEQLYGERGRRDDQRVAAVFLGVEDTRENGDGCQGRRGWKYHARDVARGVARELAGETRERGVGFFDWTHDNDG
jgi:hypothetical protein